MLSSEALPYHLLLRFMSKTVEEVVANQTNIDSVPTHQKGRLLLPLDGSSSDVPSFQLHPVFGAVSNRVPPGNAMSRFVGFGDKSRDNFKYFFRTQGFEFLFLSQRVQRADFGGSIAPKAPVLKLNRPLTRKPPAAIVSESARVVCAPFAKPQVATLRHSWEK